VHEDMLSSYLDEYMWREGHDTCYAESAEHVVTLLIDIHCKHHLTYPISTFTLYCRNQNFPSIFSHLFHLNLTLYFLSNSCANFKHNNHWFTHIQPC